MQDKLPFIINEDQTGYMKGRNISENIRTILDITKFAQKQKLNAIILSIDYEKCYDRISFKAILDSLKYFNFGPEFCRYVETCLRGTVLTIQNNGHFSETFQVFRGIKQGDCLSPFLALLVMEVLSIRIRSNVKIKGIKINEHEYKLVQFADDLTMFLQFDQEVLAEVIRTFDRFRQETNFKVNYDKTSIYRIGSLQDSNAQLYTGKPF